MKIVETFQPETNFWHEHIQLAAAGPIKILYDEDSTKGKSHSSKLMWSIALIWDRSSKYYNLPEDGKDGKIELVFTDFYGDVKYYYKNTEKIGRIKDYYRRLQETPAHRALREIEEKLEERSKFIKDTEYTLGIPSEKGTWVGGTAQIIDAMLANSEKIYKLYESATKAVEQEGTDGDINKGGGVSSLSSDGRI